MRDYPARYVENHDGDSVVVQVDQGFDNERKLHLRLANVWAPEMHERGGPQVRAMVAFLVASYHTTTEFPFVVHTEQTTKGTDVKSFDRYVATVMMPDGESLNSKLMKYITDCGYSGGTGAPKPQGPKKDA